MTERFIDLLQMKADFVSVTFRIFRKCEQLQSRVLFLEIMVAAVSKFPIEATAVLNFHFVNHVCHHCPALNSALTEISKKCMGSSQYLRNCYWTKIS